MKFPDNYLWGYPGFPSIMVSYFKTNDFFYSGHCGLPIVLLCEFNHLGMKLMQAFCIFTFIFECFTMLVLRGHYTIDIITGAIFAHYIWDKVNLYVHYVDDLTFNKKVIETEEEIEFKKNLFNNETSFIPVKMDNNDKI